MSKKLVAYFSASGVTKRAAEDLAATAGADLYEIAPEVPYQQKEVKHKMRKAVALFLAVATFFSVQTSAQSVECKANESSSAEIAVPHTDASSSTELRVHLENEETVQPENKVTNQSDLLSEVPLILQNPELPNGCEVTSLAMLLTSTGTAADKMELYDDYLPKQDIYSENGQRFGPDPAEAYAGNAASSANGWYCFESPLLEAGNSWLNTQGLPWRVDVLTDLSQKQLEEYLDQSRPLVVWVTLNYQTPHFSNYQWILPDGTAYTPYSNLHCVVLTGWDNGNYRVADPIYGWQSVSPADFWNAFSAMGSRAVSLTAVLE